MCMFVLRNEWPRGSGTTGYRCIQICKMLSWKTRMPQPELTAAGRQPSFRRPAGLRRRQAGRVCPGCFGCCSRTSCAARMVRRGGGRAGAAGAGWSSGSSEAEIPFQPGRVLMHDTTSTPALVDIAAMRDALAEAGVDPSRAATRCCRSMSRSTTRSRSRPSRAPTRSPSTCSTRCAATRERYRFLRWASKALPGVRIHPPGTGIMHTINLEQLATVVTTEQRDGARWAVPDMMIGTDSHTPMINGIGVLGWGVGGLEAQTVMFGMPTMLRIPDVVGVRLIGALRPGVLATDLALVVTQRLRALGVAGDFVEFFGPGVVDADAPASARWSPTWRPSTAPPPAFSRSTTRTLATCARPAAAPTPSTCVEALHPAQRPLVRSRRPTPRYTRTIEIDLATVAHARRRAAPAAGPAAAMPRRRAALAEARLRADGSRRRPAAPSGRDRRDHELHQHLRPGAAGRRRPGRAQGARARPRAARLGQDLARAGLARRALAISSAPACSRTSTRVGFDIVGFGCTHLHRQLRPADRGDPRGAGATGAAKPVAVLSGNRNFPRPRPPRPRSRLHHVAAAGGRLRARRRCGARPEPRAGADRAPTARRSTCATSGRRARRSTRSCERARDPATSARDFARAQPQPALARARSARQRRSSRGTRHRPTLRRPPFASVERRQPARPLHRLSAAGRSATTSPPTTSRRRARSRRTASSPTSWSSAATTATTSTCSPPGAATGR